MFLGLSFGRSLTPPDATPLRLSSKITGAAAGPCASGGAYAENPPVLQSFAAQSEPAHDRSTVGPSGPFDRSSAERSYEMTALPIRAAAASLVAIAIAACTTTGIGTGQSANGGLGATFTWRETGGARGTMVAQLSNGQVFQGPFFQITSEARVDYDPLWYGWGPGFGWHRPWSRWGGGWGGWGGWGPDYITQYSGQVLANLQGPGGFMR